MVVQHNLTAMNSNRMLGVTTKQQAKTTEKLSSGYKINRAADDAAGLAISEKMRKQIRGLTQASANAQDGISAVQTAEGALTEVHDMLQRINELAVKAANGTQSESDRQAIQSEVDQLVTEIDRVSETTKFNETYLLKGDKTAAKGYSYSYNAVKANKAAEAKMDKDEATQLTAKVEFKEGAAADDQNALAKALRDQGMTITSMKNKDGGTEYTVTLNGKADTSYEVNRKASDTFEITDLRGNKIATVTASGGVSTLPGKATIGATTLYDANGKALDAERLAAVLDKDPAAKIYTVDPTAAVANRIAVTVTDSKLAGAAAADGDFIVGAKSEAGTYKYYDTGTAGWYKLDANGNKTGEKLTVTTGSAYTANDAFSIKTGKTAQAGDIVVIKDQNIALKGTSLNDTGVKYTYTPAATGASGAQSAVVTANTIGAAENRGDVARFYDKEGNAVSNNALGNYFSVLSAGSGNGKATLLPDGSDVFSENGGTKLDKEGLLAELNAGRKVYTTPPTQTVVLSNGARKLTNGTDDILKGGTAVADLKIGDVFTYNAKASAWYRTDRDGTTDSLTVYTLAADTMTDADGTAAAPADGDTITIAMKTDAAGAGTLAKEGTDYTYEAAEKVAARAGAQLYDAVGNELKMTDAAANVAKNKNLTGVLNLGLHVGADSTGDNQIELNVEAMSAKGLGLNGLKVGGTNAKNALDAIETVKEAISKVSAQRSTLGAVQNRLEHTINNLDNVVENTTSAESAIRDTDMATTMVQYSKNNILAQAGTSMLAQANQSNQSVLSLLQ